MAIESTKTEKFGVARHDELLAPLYDTEAEARQQLAHVSDVMRGIGLDPDVDLVSVTETVSYGKPKLIKDEPAPEPADEQPADADQAPQE